jgi:hypothetical protein
MSTIFGMSTFDVAAVGPERYRNPQYLHAMTSPAGRDEEIIEVIVHQPITTVPLPDYFLDKCQASTLVPVSLTCEIPVRLGAYIRDDELTVTIDAADLEACGGWLRVVTKVSGIRKLPPEDQLE